MIENERVGWWVKKRKKKFVRFGNRLTNEKDRYLNRRRWRVIDEQRYLRVAAMSGGEESSEEPLEASLEQRLKDKLQIFNSSFSSSRLGRRATGRATLVGDAR